MSLPDFLRGTEEMHNNKFVMEFKDSSLQINEGVWGKGKILVLALHGWSATGNAKLINFAKKMSSEKYTIYIPDFPGFKDSSEPTTAWNVQDYKDFAVAYLKHHNLDTPVNILGHSFGGRVCLMLAAQNPELVNKVILNDSAGIRPRLPLKKHLAIKGFKATRNTFDFLGLSEIKQRLQEWYTNRYASPDYKKTSGIMRETIVKVINQDLRNFASRIKSPTLIIWGANDTVTPLSDAKLFKRLITNSKLVILKGAGHNSLDEQPELGVKEIEKFLNS